MKINEGLKVIDELFDPTKHVATRTQRRRLVTCMSCEHYRKLISQCKICDCIMVLKTKLKSKDCELRTPEFPYGKWQKEI